MVSEYIERIPKSSLLYRTPELPLTRLQPLFLNVLTALQSLSVEPQKVKLVEDWLDHDGLEFAKGRKPLTYLFSVASTPRSFFEKTPKDDSVYLRAESEDGVWTLRVRTDWDADDREHVGDFFVVVDAASASQFENALQSEICDGDLRKDEERG